MHEFNIKNQYCKVAGNKGVNYVTKLQWFRSLAGISRPPSKTIKKNARSPTNQHKRLYGNGRLC